MRSKKVNSSQAIHREIDSIHFSVDYVTRVGHDRGANNVFCLLLLWATAYTPLYV